MERLQMAAVLLSLVDELRERGSWCGETHIQKSVYFLKELLNVPLGVDFVLYRYGPYSFELDEQLARLMADGVFEEQLMQYPYGPKIVHGAMAKQVLTRFPKMKEQYASQISFVAECFGKSNVSELERIATALFVTKDGVTSKDVDSRAKRLIELKPHISIENAKAAVEKIDAMKEKAEPFLVRQDQSQGCMS